MRRTFPLFVLAGASACLDAGSADEQSTARLGIVENLFDDMKNVDLGDLVRGAGHLATDEINGVLAEVPFSDIQLSETEFYGLEDEHGHGSDLTIRNIDELAGGLADRFGERSLPAQVNMIRRAHLAHSGDRIFAETSFRLGGQIDLGWRWEAPGIGMEVGTHGSDGDDMGDDSGDDMGDGSGDDMGDGSGDDMGDDASEDPHGDSHDDGSSESSHGGSHDDGMSEHRASVEVGFEMGASVEARVIAAYPNELDATLRNPLAALKELRGFVIPRDFDDVRNGMKPGESFVLRSAGRVGLNFGVGVPLLVANPIQTVTYSIVLSGGLRTVLEGDLDVQLLRMEGDEVLVDVGLSNARVSSAYLAIDDSFGLHGLVRSNIAIGGVNLDVGSLVDRVLTSELNRRVSLISARAERTQSSVRESVARFRVDLARATPEVRTAIEQAVRGDLRLAQGLANRGEPGIVSDLDVVRAGRTTYGHLGFGILGMRFFRETERSEGQVTVQTPGGALSVMFESLRHESGSFFSEHGYARTVLSGVESPVGGTADGQTNLYYSWKEGDDYMERDKLADHLDGLLAVLLGADSYAPIAASLDEIGRLTQAACAGMSNFDADNGAAYRRCKMDVLARTDILGKVTAIRAAFDQAIGAGAIADGDGMGDGHGSGGHEGDGHGGDEHGPVAETAMASALFDLAVAANRAYEPQAALAGPPTDIALATWMSDDAIGELLTGRTGADLRAMLEAIVPLLRADRDRPDGLSRARRGLDARALDSLERQFDGFRQRYEDLVALSAEQIPRVGVVGDQALTVTVPVDRELVPQYEQVVVRSIARRRGDVVSEMVDQTIRALRDLGGKPERFLGYALLGLTHPSMRDVRVDIDMSLRDNWAQDFPQYREAGYAPLHAATRGANVRLLGQQIAWDIDRLAQIGRTDGDTADDGHQSH